ncbi:transcriptional regulator, TetR family [Nocardia nova SH22a]|uniref:Transcriptional regulator, TetR family n=1 Tax=Nocardia nova SH22a TaxID=1415166 RepID=W5TFI4_9NOCA|nr:TetR/AcrR family transcriptional regulator [Nocardia nova]AHH16011.1 transcriptional regulator, TetR family [Nocardia nova SH22a]
MDARQQADARAETPHADRGADTTGAAPRAETPRTAPRTWGGRTPEQRRAERRARLLAAALDIWLENGWAAVTMRGVCARAALNDRYFYEHFADRDELLATVWDEVCIEVFGELTAVTVENIGRPPLEIQRMTIERAIELQSGHARILSADHAGSAILEARRSKMLADATDWLMAAAGPYLHPGVDPLSLRMSTLMGIGGFLELLAAWRAGTLDVDAERLIEHTGAHAALLSAQYLEITPE